MSEFTKKALERVRSGAGTEPMAKKRKISRIILLVDIVIVVIILMFFGRDSGDSQYYTNSLIYNQIVYRFSLTKESGHNNYIFSLTALSESKNTKSEEFSGSVAYLEIGHVNTVFFQSPVGENINRLSLLPGESKTFLKEIDISVFTEFADAHPELLIPGKKSLIMLEKQHIPLCISITLNTAEKLTTKLNFKYEVD